MYLSVSNGGKDISSIYNCETEELNGHIKDCIFNDLYDFFATTNRYEAIFWKLTK